MQKIILASRSPRRKQLLELANIPFEIRYVDTEETYPEGLSAHEVAIHIARNKAKVLLNNDDEINLPVLSADTIVVLDDEIIGKPPDKEEAIKILSKLSGRLHKVITGVIISHGENELAFYDVTEVEFYPLSQQQIEYYIDACKPFDKAGAYAIQEWIGAVAIKKIKGDFYNVMGLPISRVIKELERIGK